jgi:hypothetical protein
MSSWGSLFGAGANYAAMEEVLKRLDELGQQSSTGMDDIATDAMTNTEFVPYTVKTGDGTFTTTASGGLDFAMNREAQKRQDKRFAEAESLFNRAAADPTENIQGIYDQIRATQQPEEARNLSGVQQGLFNTGRGGISSAQYGGSPEQFAFEKARQETMNQAALSARGVSNEERAADLTQAMSLSGMGYMGQDKALSMFDAAGLPAQLAQKGQLSGAELAAQSQIAGLEGLLSMGQVGAETSTAFLRSLVESLTSSGGLFDF